MRYSLLLILFFGVSMCYGNVDDAQALFVQYKFHRLDEDQGLKNSVINDIDQDTLGQMWVGTEHGVFRYDGSKFYPYLHYKDEKNSLPNNYIADVHVDKENRVWFMTDGGVGLYEYKRDEIIHYEPEEINEPVTSMVIDGNGNRYFGLYNGGIIKSNGELERLNLLDREQGLDYGNYGTSSLHIVNNNLWVVLDGKGLVKINLANNEMVYVKPEQFAGQPEIEIWKVQHDHASNIWVLTELGLFKVRESYAGPLKVEKILPDLFPQDDYMSFYEDKFKNIWIGTRQNGMYSFHNDGELVDVDVHHFEPSNSERGLSYRTISTIFQDNDGLFWLGTHNAGINVFNPEGEEVRFLTHSSLMDHSLNFQNIWGLSESHNGNIWIGTDGKGINVLNPTNEEITIASWPELQEVAVLSLLEDNSKRLWVGTYENGLFQVDLKTQKIRQFRTGGNSPELRVNDIREIYESTHGDIFIGTNQGGAYYFNEQTSKLEMLKGTDNMDVRSIAMTSDGSIWMGTYRNGLVFYSDHGSELVKYSLSEYNQQSIVSIFDMYLDGNSLLLGTREIGLVRFDLIEKKYDIDFPPILSRQSISAILKDNSGNLWMTTSNGVFSFNEETQAIYTFDHNDGFQSGHFNYGSILKGKNDFMVVAGIKGMNLFNPDELLQQESTDPIVFNELKILDKKVTPMNSKVFPVGKSIFLTEQIELENTDNFFTIGFSIPGFSIKKQNEFVFKLEGYDSDWQHSGYVNEVTYRNVPPGDYLFKVMNLRNESNFKELAVIIHPPIWQTWQAYVLFSVVIILLLFWYMRFNNSRVVLKKNLEFEQTMREKEQSTMREKLSFYTNFSHELKTPLTLIQGPVNDLLKKENDEDKIQYLRLIKKNTSILLKFIGRMLEFRKIEMNKTVLNVGLHDLNVLAQEEAESFKYLSKEKGVIFGFYCEPDLNVWVDIEKIQIVLNNLLSNAIKFSPNGKTVKFGMFHKGDEVVIEVKDQGEGISNEELTHIFSPFYQASNTRGKGGTGIGLALCKSFLELHHGSISVESDGKKGTVFIVRLKKGKSHLEGLDYVRFVEIKEEEDIPQIPEASPDNPEEVYSDSDRLLLIVDDNSDITSYVKTLFANEYKVLVSDSAEDAFEVAVNAIPDLIISDLMMPGMDGIEFCKMLKENVATSHVPVVLLTAKNSNPSKIKSFEYGADDYITKPFSSDLLKVRVNNLLKSRKVLELKYSSNNLLDAAAIKSSREAEFILNVESTVCSLIESSEFSVPDLCKELGMSQTSLYRKIKNLTGDSIQLFIRKIKIKRAAHLLITEDMTVSEVAFAMDFSDLKYFRKCFKEQFNATPSEYKNDIMSQVSN